MRRLVPRRIAVVACVLLSALAAAARAEEPAADPVVAALAADLETTVRPLLAAHCIACHDEATQESGVRLDALEPFPTAAALPLWDRIRKVAHAGSMPPEDAPQPDAAGREALVRWLDRGIAVARSRPTPRNGSIRRLTVAQWRNSIRDLLGIDDDVAAGLPPDPVSRDGFTNQSATIQFTPLQAEAFLDAASRGLDAALVDPDAPPRIERFRVALGRGVNPDPSPESLVLGHISQLLPNADVLVTEPVPQKPFPFERAVLRRHFRYIEGYQGNDTVRGWREFAGLHHNVFACLRGSDGDDTRRVRDPRGRNAEVVANGLLLRPSIPGARFLGDASKYGPLPNFKIAVRDLPRQGRFRVTVTASRPPDGLLVGTAADAPVGRTPTAVVRDAAAGGACDVPIDGVYLLEVAMPGVGPLGLEADGSAPATAPEVVLDVGAFHVAAPRMQPAFVVLRLPAGPVRIRAVAAGDAPVAEVALVPLDPAEPLALRHAAFEARVPRLGVHLGLRRDCGSTLAPVGRPQGVAAAVPEEHVFEGAIANFPDPDVEADNPNYLAGIREIAVRSECTDGRDVPRLLVHAVEFEGPFLESWPPASHRAICDVPGGDAADPAERARAILGGFATRAFRRPATQPEVEALVGVWRRATDRGAPFMAAVREGLLAALVAPQFLFLVEASAGPGDEPLDGHELASKLAFFLWNSPPDRRLLDLAAAGTLGGRLAEEVDRMIDDDRFSRFADTFATEWLGLDRFDVVETDRARHPRLTAHAKPSLRAEPARLLEHLIRGDAPVSDLIDGDVVVVDEIAADYYGLGDLAESGFDFLAVRHGREDLGGLLTLPAVLAGLSDGREPNPVKRGAWLARKIVARPPPDPPPNVPKLEDLTQLSLRERLARHRSAAGCTACHEGIDPWGLPLEAYDAAGRFRGEEVDASTRLPDGAETADFAAFRGHLRSAWLGDVAFSFLKHLATYAAGRPPSPVEERALREAAQAAVLRGDGLRAIVHSVAGGEMFLLK